MQRKQQVGECWVFVIFFACVCVGASDLTTASDDPSSSSLCFMCARCFPRGVSGGRRYVPPWLCLAFRTTPPNLFFGWILLFFVDFSIFSDFLN
jgi:hypothetical protein